MEQILSISRRQLGDILELGPTIIETVNEILNASFKLLHARDRSFYNFLVHSRSMLVHLVYQNLR